MKNRFLLLATLFASVAVYGSGHGPAFGYATPTNSQGEFSFDFGLMGRTSNHGSQASLRGMIAYGFTPTSSTCLQCARTV